MSKKGPKNDSSAKNDELLRLREEIDRVDLEILGLLNERAQLVKLVGGFKRKEGRSVYSFGRERDLISKLEKKNSGPFPVHGLAPVFKEIVSGTRSLERRLKVGYLGPEGTFSHLAALEAFGKQVEFLSKSSFTDILSEIVSGKLDHGLLPIENSTEGVVTQALDSLADVDVTIAGEVLLRVSLCIMSKTGSLKDVRRVASHPQPLAQARKWLELHLPGVKKVPLPSTAEAARLAVDSEDLAAIGPLISAEYSGLEVIERGIEDRQDNTTRFLILGGDAPSVSGSDLTSVVFTVRKDESGALHRLLKPFAVHEVNLAGIQSRPLKGAPWEYRFFLDLEGHSEEVDVQKAISAASEIATSTRVLGAFPRALDSQASKGNE